MSLFDAHPNGVGSVIRRLSHKMGQDIAGFAMAESEPEVNKLPVWATTELPASMRIGGGHAAWSLS